MVNQFDLNVYRDSCEDLQHCQLEATIYSRDFLYYHLSNSHLPEQFEKVNAQRDDYIQK